MIMGREISCKEAFAFEPIYNTKVKTSKARFSTIDFIEFMKQ